ncbi:PAS domain S-box protein [Dethiobacter alkaliphilus]|uniref:histidine kinase n=1 Tax=Dethiobacter alkaliphilus AHT 1 TaxID=555088 RepID=C0GH42_DETAL|nr:PAS domain S-box protein [Dethiobacter alkaliphilus]EEG77344.1 multi-sensor signal transduction histidine kinase [Dethiobacter alkaliphilus AHT 1]
MTQTLKAAILTGSFMLLAGLMLEAGPDLYTWGRYLFVLLIFGSGVWFRYAGVVAAGLMSFSVLVSHSFLMSTQMWLSLSHAALIPAVGVLAGLYWISVKEFTAMQHYTMAWYKKMRKKHYNKTRARIEQDKQLATLSDYSQRVAFCADIEDVIRIGLDLARDTMRVDAVAIYSLPAEDETLYLVSSCGLQAKEAAKNQPIPLGEGFNGKAAESGNLVVAYDFQKDFEVSDALRDEEFRAVAVVPLVSRNKIMGTLMVANRRHHIFSAQELLVLETLGHQLGMAKENTILTDVQQTMQKQLRESEKQYRGIFEKTNDIIWLEDGEGNIISANKACANMLGIELSRLKKENIFTYIPHEQAQKAKLVRQQLFNGTIAEKSYDQTIVNNEGTEIILKVTTNLLDNGDIPGFQHIAKDITEERKLHENQQFYIEHITRAQEEERLRISRELHDSTAQSLIVVLHQLEKYLVSSDHLRLGDSRFLFNVAEQVKAILQEVRQFSRDLRPSILDDLGLVPSLEWYIDELNRTHGLKVDLNIIGQKQMLRPEIRVSLFRIIQEALRNVMRHAEANNAKVKIEFDNNEVRVVVQDNGKGFDAEPLGDLLRNGKLGLAGMHERAKILGGSIEISSAKGAGTTIFIAVPLVSDHLLAEVGQK